MRIYFEKLILHNFLSFGHSEINLKEKGYCLVSGINNDKRDNSLSNGSGKSSWSSALAWVLTGETIQGKKNNLKNIWVEEDLCYVTVIFTLDGNRFEITRYKEPKSNMTITINGEDKSGKGIKESESILAEYIPDLTSELLASIIILGQGLPQKFSSNSPSGRKEVLEKLSKSDYMIQDIKNRLAKVISDNNSDLRKIDDTLLTLDTKQELLTTQKAQQEVELQELKKPNTFEEDIKNIQKDIDIINEEKTLYNNKVNDLESQYTLLTTNLTNLNTTKANEVNALRDQFHDDVEVKYYTDKNKVNTNKTLELNELTTTFNSNVNNLKDEYMKNSGSLNIKLNSTQTEIKRIKSIKDICPTCGQKIPNVIKPDTTKLEDDEKTILNELNSLKENYTNSSTSLLQSYNANKQELEDKYINILNSIENDYMKRFEAYNGYLKEINERYSNDINICNINLNNLQTELSQNKKLIEIKNNDLLNKTQLLNKLKLEYSGHDEKIKQLTLNIQSLTKTLNEIEKEKLYNNNERNSISDKLSIDKKIETLIKRDFRGFLLSNIINYINSKCKEYSLDIFGNSDLDFILDGNNLEISYLGKSFENLSGGEKQKVDLIIQFAIRDMMSEYLDFSCNIFILDEIFDNLDSIGCTKVLNLIANRLNDIESMFIISHHADELEIPYDCEMIIIKDENGISKVK